MPHHRLSLLALIVLLTGLVPGGAAAQADQRCFTETPVCIGGRFDEFWTQNGGLPVFGLPLTPAQAETVEGVSVQVQWFERARLELHPDQPRPYDVLLGRLGADRLTQLGRDWHAFPTGGPAAGCQVFSQTGHSVCGTILAAWRASGLEFDGDPAGKSEAESLALFGLPLSGPVTETIEGRSYQVQWFERARFEMHPENAPPFDVLLGLLGRETRAQPPATPGPATPTPVPAVPVPATPVPGAEYDGGWFGHNTTDDLQFDFLISGGRLLTVEGRFRVPLPDRRYCELNLSLDYRTLGDPPKVDSSGFRFVYQSHRFKVDGSGRFDGPNKASGIVSYELFDVGICSRKAGFNWSTERRAVTLLPVDGTWEGSTGRGEAITFTIKDRVVTSFEIVIGRQEECRVRVELNRPIDGNNLSIVAQREYWAVRFQGQFSSATEVRGQASVDSTRGSCRAANAYTDWNAKRRQ